ncbi:BTB/POZ domain-containing protein [Rhizophagus diaphanus]|nr:BTB/POZ domain-containing protein [Rhizophagus diaphanus] [Rhizophagus sp. MUCL 43196]
MSYKFWEAVINDYEKLLETRKGSDVIIYAGENEKEFRAHSVILCARSEYFRAAFSNNWAEKKDGMLIFKKPNIESNLLQIILRFIYCGDVDLTKLQGSEVLKLLIAVDELDIQPLISCIQEYFLTINKSDSLYQNLLEIVYQHEKFTDLWNFCFDRICEEPEKLINTDKFINLKAPLLEMLLKRDDFALDEIIIWEGLIKWGLAQNSTIPKDVKKWSKEQFTIMERILHRFIPLVRFHHISSDVFFYKVLPYKKLLPKLLVYEITEYNMVPDKKSTINIQTPRKKKLSLKFGSSLIDSNHFAIFASWIDKKDSLYYNFKNIPYNFDLLYRASRDGKDINQFHNKCDNKGATIVITQVEGTNQIIGGYNPLAWDSSNSSKTTTNSFIFSLADKNDVSTATIGRVKNPDGAICCYSDSGPAFGSNWDCDLCYTKYDKKWICSADPFCYHSINLAFTYFIADDYEVFQVIKK